MFDHPELVDFAIGLVNSVVNSPDAERSFLGNSDYRRTVTNPIHQNLFFELPVVEMTVEIVQASCSLPK